MRPPGGLQALRLDPVDRSVVMSPPRCGGSWRAWCFPLRNGILCGPAQPRLTPLPTGSRFAVSVFHAECGEGGRPSSLLFPGPHVVLGTGGAAGRGFIGCA